LPVNTGRDLGLIGLRKGGKASTALAPRGRAKQSKDWRTDVIGTKEFHDWPTYNVKKKGKIFQPRKRNKRAHDCLNGKGGRGFLEL